MSNILRVPLVLVKRFTKRINQALNKKAFKICSDLKEHKVFCVKEPTYEETVLTKVFKIREEDRIHLFHDGVYGYSIPNGVVIPENDFVIAEEGALFKKSNHPMFGAVKTQDRNVVKIKSDLLYVLWPKKVININFGFNLCGTNSNVWSHFMIQFLPKLFYISKIKELMPKGEKLAILLDDFIDKQVLEIIENYIAGDDTFFLKLVPLNSRIHCQTLFHIDNMSFISDFDATVSNSDIVVPSLVASLLKKNLCNRFSFPINKKYKKLFIVRKSKFRNITNYDEVESFFKNKGYYLIDPGKISLKEKIEAFSSAKIIAGPASSGFTNLVFCDGAKALRISNFQRINDGYFPFILENWNVKGICLIGKDEDPYDSHSSYSVNMNDLKEICIMEGF